MMEKVLFASLTSERDKRFQICTTIIDRNGKLLVRKEALNNESVCHIRSIFTNEKTLKETYKNCKLFKICKIRDKSDEWVEYAYFDEFSLEKKLESCDDDEKIELLTGLWNELLKCSVCGKKITADYRKIFGDGLTDAEGLHWSKNQNVDLSFSNLYVKDKKYLINDYEWVFSFAVPLEFIFFRSIFYSDALSDKEKYYQIVKISKDNLEKFISTENSFQKYVVGNTLSLWEHYDRFSKGYENWNIKELRIKEKQEREDNNSLNIELKNKSRQIKQNNKKIIEKNNEIEEVRQLLSKKEKENIEKDEQIERLTYIYRELNEIKKSTFVKAMYAWYRFRDGIFPEGSRRRVFAKVLFEIIKHPVKTLGKLSLQRIGKFLICLINGDVNTISQKVDDVTVSDFEITKLEVLTGQNFTKLYFKKNNNPLVSIVIPAYNQFYYTYHCLESILKHCNNTSYEVIIGDDNSDDQTAKISEYVDNVTILRNNET